MTEKHLDLEEDDEDNARLEQIRLLERHIRQSTGTVPRGTCPSNVKASKSNHVRLDEIPLKPRGRVKSRKHDN